MFTKPDNPSEGDPLLLSIQQAYEASGIPITKLAEDFGVTPEKMHLYVNGQIDLSMSQIRRLANSLKLLITYEVVPNQKQLKES